jgi:hypothetical protein
MRISFLRILTVAGFAVTSLAGQHAGIINTGPLVAPPINAPRFGNVLSPGGIYGGGPSHITNLGKTIAGRPIGGAHLGAGRAGFGGGRGRGGTLIVPYAVPLGYVGGYDGYGGYYPQPEPVTIVVPQQPTPTVIINQSFSPQTANPVLRDYSNSELPESPRGDVRVYEAPVAPRPEGQSLKKATRVAVDESATIYMIALKDETIRQAIGYWFEGDTLHYVTPGGTINRVSLDQVDREASERLNRERNVEFSLRR